MTHIFVWARTMSIVLYRAHFKSTFSSLLFRHRLTLILKTSESVRHKEKGRKIQSTFNHGIIRLLFNDESLVQNDEQSDEKKIVRLKSFYLIHQLNFSCIFHTFGLQKQLKRTQKTRAVNNALNTKRLNISLTLFYYISVQMIFRLLPCARIHKKRKIMQKQSFNGSSRML